MSVVQEDDNITACEWTSNMGRKKTSGRLFKRTFIDSKFFSLRDKTYIFGMASKSRIIHVIKQYHISM